MTTNRRNGYIEIKPHWGKKHRILGKYISACLVFQKNYDNFAYVDTHGGSGQVLLVGNLRDGSPLIAAKELGTFPCYTTEINPGSFQRLAESTRSLRNVKAVQGDCNVIVPEILKEIDSHRFCLCFVDPDGLVYYDGGKKVMQLRAETVDAIARSTGPRTELLLNLPIMQIMRVRGFVDSLPDEPKAPAMEEDLDVFYGCSDWRGAGSRRELLDIFIDRRLSPYGFKGAFLVSDSDNRPLYYLVYGSRNGIGAKIMKAIMLREYNQLLLDDYPMERFYFD